MPKTQRPRRRLCQHPGCRTEARGNDHGGKARYCRHHGGGPRCRHPWCATSAEGDGRGGKPLFCKVHGGGPRCQHRGCHFSAERDGSKKRPRFCMRHGGGYRCQHPDHVWPGSGIPPSASFLHRGVRLCHQHYYNNVNGTCRAIKREIIVLGEIMAHLPGLLGLSHEEFQRYFINHDSNIRSCKLIRRPDLLFGFPHFAVLLEIDEHCHRDRSEISELEHLEVIRQYVAEHHRLRHMYVLRINPDGKNPMFCRKKRSNGEIVWEPTDTFADKFRAVVRHVVPWIRAATGPRHRLRHLFEEHPQACVVQKLYFDNLHAPPRPPPAAWRQRHITDYLLAGSSICGRTVA